MTDLTHERYKKMSRERTKYIKRSILNSLVDYDHKLIFEHLWLLADRLNESLLTNQTSFLIESDGMTQQFLNDSQIALLNAEFNLTYTEFFERYNKI